MNLGRTCKCIKTFRFQKKVFNFNYSLILDVAICVFHHCSNYLSAYFVNINVLSPLSLHSWCFKPCMACAVLKLWKHISNTTIIHYHYKSDDRAYIIHFTQWWAIIYLKWRKLSHFKGVCLFLCFAFCFLTQMTGTRN